MRTAKAAAAIMAAALMFSSFTTPAAAFTQRLDDLVSHFIDCKLLLLTDLDAHVRECGGGVMPTTFQSLSEKVDGGPPQTVPTSKPEEPDDCEGEESSFCECEESQECPG